MKADEKLFLKALNAAGVARPDSKGEVLRELDDEFQRTWRAGFIVGYQVALSGEAYEPEDD